MREIITLQCGDCKNRNYTTSKNKKKHTERLETKKFCNTSRPTARTPVSKTGYGGSNPSSPARVLAFAGRTSIKRTDRNVCPTGLHEDS